MYYDKVRVPREVTDKITDTIDGEATRLGQEVAAHLKENMEGLINAKVH